MLSYKEYDNAQAVEIVLQGRVSTEEFDRIASKLEAFIARHGQIRVLEVIEDFEGMDAIAFWHDVKFSLRHLQDFSRIAIVTNPDVHHLWSSLVAPFISCEVEHFAPGRDGGRARLADVAGRRRRRLTRILWRRLRRRLVLDRLQIIDDRLDIGRD